MAVKIRLKRMGANKKPFYRIVVADSRSPRDGKFIEEIGYYNPVSANKETKINDEKALKWLSVGAQPTDEYMKELVMYIVKALVDNPDEVTVEETMQKDEIILKLKVSQDDVGKVIGKQGRIAKAIRTVLKSAGNKENIKVSLEIL